MDGCVGIDNRDEHTLDRWSSRLPTSVAVSALAFLVPMGCGLAWVSVVAVTVSIDDRLASQARWWSMLVVGLGAIVLLSARVSRRLLPVSALLRLDLEFPEQAPNRLWMGLAARSERSVDPIVVVDGDLVSVLNSSAVRLLQLTMADRTARRHAERVRRFALLIGSELFLAADDRLRLQWFSLLHDIDATGETIDPLRPWLGDWTDARAAKIVDVAAAYDTLTSIELQRKPLTPDGARVHILERAGSTFDPEVVDAFVAVPPTQMDRTISSWGGVEVWGSAARRLSLPRLATASAIVLSLFFGAVFAAQSEQQSLAFHDPVEPDLAVHDLSDATTTDTIDTTHSVRTPSTTSQRESTRTSAPRTSDGHRPPFDYRDYIDESGDTNDGQHQLSVAGPQPVADSASTSEDTPVTVNVLANDGSADVTLDVASLRVVSTSAGEVTISGGWITYSPPPDASGTARIVYEICTTTGICGTASLVITVSAVEDVVPFSAEGELKIPSDAGPQVIPWLVVSAGKPALADGTVVSTTTDRRDLFVAIPRISNVGTLTFEPREGSEGVAMTTIRVAEPGEQRRTYVLRLIVG